MHWERSEKALFVSFGSTVLLIFLLVFWYQRTNEAVTLHIPPRPAPPSPNAYDFYTRAASMLVKGDDIDRAFTARPKKKLPLSDKERLVAENQNALTEFRKGLRCEYGNPSPHSINAPVIPYVDFRRLGRLLSLEEETRLARRDYSGATESALHRFRFASDIPRDRNVIDAAIGLLIERLEPETVWCVTKKVSAPDARTAAHQLEILAARRVSLADSVQEEKWFNLTEMAAFFKKGSVLQFYQGLNGSPSVSMGSPGSLVHIGSQAREYTQLLRYSKGEVLRNYGNYMDDVTAYLRRPYNSAASPPPPPADPVSQLFAPNIAKLGQTYRAAQAQQALLTITFALRAYQLEHDGISPVRLADLTRGGYLRAIPADPFSPTSALLRYRRAGENGYVLYSIGPDGIDNQGKAIAPRFSSEGRWKFAGERVLGDIVAGINTE